MEVPCECCIVQVTCIPKMIQWCFNARPTYDCPEEYKTEDIQPSDFMYADLTKSCSILEQFIYNISRSPRHKYYAVREKNARTKIFLEFLNKERKKRGIAMP